MSHEQGAHKSWVSRICYAIGNLGQAAYYNALSTFFVTYYAAQTLFRDYEAEEATAMIGIITALVFIIRIVEIFIDPLLGNLVDNTTTRWGRFKPWRVKGQNVCLARRVAGVRFGLFECRLSGCSRCR